MIASFHYYGFFLIAFGICISGCLDFGETYTRLPPGPWRGVLKLDPELSRQQTAPHETRARDDVSFEEVTEGDLPFTFEVIYRDRENLYLEIHNGNGKIILDQITFLKDRATNKDTVIVAFPPYDSYFKLIFEDNILEGTWNVPSLGNYEVHFIARHGQNYRFTTLKKPPVADLSGKWQITFGPEDSIPEPGVGYLEQKGNHLTGTFVSKAGDFGFLEGTVQANKMYLSGFDGSHMYLLEALIRDDGSLSGIFRDGIHTMKSWSGVRNDNFNLPDPGSIVTTTNETLTFSFPNDQGELISLDDPEFTGKPKVIQLMGTWCSNCLDETRFLHDYFEKYNPEVALIALAFERYQDPDRAMKAIARYREALDIHYPILYAGHVQQKEASRKLPVLSDISVFPTLIFLDPANRVKQIFTGFRGPAVPEYSQFESRFEEMLKRLEIH